MDINKAEYTKLVGNRIKQIRKQKNIKLDELSDISKVDYSYLSKVERGLVNCSIKKYKI